MRNFYRNQWKGKKKKNKICMKISFDCSFFFVYRERYAAKYTKTKVKRETHCHKSQLINIRASERKWKWNTNKKKHTELELNKIKAKEKSEQQRREKKIALQPNSLTFTMTRIGVFSSCVCSFSFVLSVYFAVYELCVCDFFFSVIFFLFFCSSTVNIRDCNCAYVCVK